MATGLGAIGLAPILFLLARAYNWHRVDAGLFRSAQMYRGHSRMLLRHNAIATVINLRGSNPRAGWYAPEAAACAELGIAYIDCRMHSRRLPSRDVLLELVDAFDRAVRPILVKCSGGADRSGFAALIYLLQQHGADILPQARRQLLALPYLHLPGRQQLWIRRFPDFFAVDNDGAPFAQWLRTRYSAERFAEWLDRQGLAGSWRR